MNQIYAVLAFLLTVTSGLIADVIHEDSSKESDEVQNVIDNMVSGDVSPAEAHKYLFDLKFWTKKNNIDANGVETQVNIDYINSALDVVTAYGNYGKDSKEFTEMYGIMQEKKDLI